MSRQDQPSHAFQRVQVRRALDQGDHKIYIEGSDEDDGNWSDSPSEFERDPLPERRGSSFHDSSPRRLERLRTQSRKRLGYDPYAAANANIAGRPSPSTYNAGASGQIYGYEYPIRDPDPRNRNPFSPSSRQPQPPPQPRPAYRHIPVPKPSTRHPTPNYPANLHHPTESHDRSDSWYPNNNFQEGSYVPLNSQRPVNTYSYPRDSNFYTSQPPLPRYGPYETEPAAQPMPVEPSTPQYQSERSWREQDAREEKKLQRAERRVEAAIRREERRREERRREERRKEEREREKMKKDIKRLKKDAERNARSETNETLPPGRSYMDFNSRSDPGMTQLYNDMRLFPTLARQMQDALLHLDERRRTEPDDVLDEVAEFLERRRRQGGRWSYAGSIRSSYDGASTRKIDGLPRASYDARADPNFRNQVQEVLIDLLRSLKLEGRVNDPLPLPPTSEQAAPQVYPLNEDNRRTRNREPSSARSHMHTTRVSSHESEYIDDYPEPRAEFSRSTARSEGNPPPPQPVENSRKPQSRRKDTNVSETQPTNPAGVDSGYSSPPIAQGARHRDGQQFETPRERSHYEARPRERREVNREAFSGIISSSESEDEDFDPRNPPHQPALYSFRPGHPNLDRDGPLPTVPNVPLRR